MSSVWYYIYQTLFRIGINAPSVNPDKVVEVHDGIFIGSLSSVYHEESMRPIGAIVNLSSINYETPLPQLNILMDDRNIAPEEIHEYLKRFQLGLKFIRKQRMAGNNVLVHCAAGINRSATLIALYLITCGMTYDEAVLAVSLANNARGVPALTNGVFRMICATYAADRVLFKCGDK